ncbi:hypothetical protein CFC21_056905 [Triticum aestivum]|uniref:Uncharacterized protein n=4 Tax=Triticum TaxID=4564 RepID=A0A9R0WA92_TRITD|nr:hypothetical protein CFC21_056905 [Triticum aestivum]VAI03076.1 unnamed protein product [Triticum turgidum subsp. durum]
MGPRSAPPPSSSSPPPRIKPTTHPRLPSLSSSLSLKKLARSHAPPTPHRSSFPSDPPTTTTAYIISPLLVCGAGGISSCLRRYRIRAGGMGRSPCCEKAHTNKGAWTKEEDQRLIAYIKAHGEGCWRSLPKAAGLLRCGKSCRLRWINYLRPDLKRGNFTEEEDELIIKLHELLGNKWSLIAGRLPGRTDNEIKNYWNTHIKRKLLARGMDPHTHRPLNAIAAAAMPAQQQQQLRAAHERHFAAATPGGHHLQPQQQDPFAALSSSAEPACSHSSDDEPAGSATPPPPSRRHLGIDLNLSISLAPYQPDDPAVKQEAATTGSQNNATTSTSAVCMCLNRLGFQGAGEGCRCGGASSVPMQQQASSAQRMFRFIAPLEGGGQ